MILEIIEYPQIKHNYIDMECPVCGEWKVYHSIIPCPEGRVGCAVLHYGYICNACGGVSRAKIEEREQLESPLVIRPGDQENFLTVSGNLGIGVSLSVQVPNVALGTG